MRRIAKVVGSHAPRFVDRTTAAAPSPEITSGHGATILAAFIYLAKHKGIKGVAGYGGRTSSVEIIVARITKFLYHIGLVNIESNAVVLGQVFSRFVVNIGQRLEQTVLGGPLPVGGPNVYGHVVDVAVVVNGCTQFLVDIAANNAFASGR